MLPTSLNSPRFYTDEELTTLKGDSQVVLGAAHSKQRMPSRRNDGTFEVKIVCKAHRAGGCPFELVFQQQTTNQFQLESYKLEHLEGCHFDAQTLAFFDSRNRLIKLKPWISQFVKRHDTGPHQDKPIKLLELINMELTGGRYNIIEVGVKSADSKTKLKKKFDNIVNEIRAKLRKEKTMTDHERKVQTVKPDFLPQNIYPIRSHMSPFKPVRIDAIQACNRNTQDACELQQMASEPVRLELQPPEFTPFQVINTPVKTERVIREQPDSTRSEALDFSAADS